MRRALLVLAAVLLPVPAFADIVFTASSPMDLSNLMVGDTFTIDLFGFSADAGEHITLINLGWDVTAIAGFDSIQLAPSLFDDLTGTPLLAIATFTAISPGSGTALFTAADAGEFVNTNLGTFNPVSNQVPFTTAVPEPASVLLLGTLLVVFTSVYRRQLGRASRK